VSAAVRALPVTSVRKRLGTMRVIPKHEIKRGDALIHDKEYVITYIYVDRDAKATLRAKLRVYTIWNNQEKCVREWFETTYPLYEILKISQDELTSDDCP
jgi:hypothetical protein